MIGIIELSRAVADKTGWSQSQCHGTMAAAFFEIASALKAGTPVKLPGLGVISVADRAPRVARNPITGDRLDVPPRRALKFKQARAVREELNPPAPAVPRS